MTAPARRSLLSVIVVAQLAAFACGPSPTPTDASTDTSTPDDASGDAGCIRTNAVDVPDHDVIDSNCDGIDGDASDAIFVSTTGLDAMSPNVGGRYTPARTIRFGLMLALMRGRSQVLIANGTYLEPIELVNGIGLYGGYDESRCWSPASGEPRTPDPECWMRTVGGAGAYGGGASIALLASGASVHATNVRLTTVGGGEGGRGGDGQYGGNGGMGGAPGAYVSHPSLSSCTSYTGADGGNGGRDGGAGGGGLGGPSVGVVFAHASFAEASSGISFDLGEGGPGGISGDLVEQAASGPVIESVTVAP